MLLKKGDVSNDVLKLQELLVELGYKISDSEMKSFKEETFKAVLNFQQKKKIMEDGICGPETWNLLIESNFLLGDRLLYEKTPMLKGSDVSELQQKLNSLGFDSGKEDGIFGPRTSNALKTFQEDMELKIDSICGPLVIKTINSISKFSKGSSFGIREKYLFNPNRELIVLAAPLSSFNLLNIFTAPNIQTVNLSDKTAYDTINSIDSAFNITIRTNKSLTNKVEIKYYEKNNSYSMLGKTLAEELKKSIQNFTNVNVLGSETLDVVLTKKPTVQISLAKNNIEENYKICTELNQSIEISLLPKLLR